MAGQPLNINSNKYQDYIDNKREESGVLDPLKVNEMEKNANKYLQFNKARKKQELQQKIKNNEVVSYSDTSWGRTISTSLSNLPSNFAPYMQEYTTAIIEAMSHPIVTTKSLKDLAIGTFKLGATRTIAYQLGISLDEEKMKKDFMKPGSKHKDIGMALSMEKSLYDNFGTEENLKRFIAENPTETILTLGEIFIPAGKLAKMGGAAKFGSALEKTGAMLDPINLALKPLTRGVPYIVSRTPKLKHIPIINKFNFGLPLETKMKDLPNNIYGRALKLSNHIPIEKQKKLIDLALDSKLTLSMDDLNKLWGTVDDLNDVINDMVNAVGPDSKMLFNDAFKYLDDLEKTYLKTSTEPVKSQINAVKKILIKNKGDFERITGKSRKYLSAQEVQAFKVQFNKELSTAYQGLANKVAKTPLQKRALIEINRSFREFLETVIPEAELLKYKKLSNAIIQKHFPGAEKLSIKELNRLEGNLIELGKAMDDVAQKHGKGSLFDFQLTAKTATGVAGGHFIANMVNSQTKVFQTAGFTLGMMFGILDSNPLVKSKIAVFLNGLQSIGLGVRPNAALIRMGLYESEKFNKEENMRKFQSQYQQEKRESVKKPTPSLDSL